ncbi:hypothetical protein C2E23DRAFT_68394 [Lenzites betulinus]|nr:hypothetical protein C2E23DRAFT_68394 [Lenzites betulinus]
MVSERRNYQAARNVAWWQNSLPCSGRRPERGHARSCGAFSARRDGFRTGHRSRPARRACPSHRPYRGGIRKGADPPERGGMLISYSSPVYSGVTPGSMASMGIMKRNRSPRQAYTARSSPLSPLRLAQEWRDAPATLPFTTPR